MGFVVRGSGPGPGARGPRLGARGAGAEVRGPGLGARDPGLGPGAPRPGSRGPGPGPGPRMAPGLKARDPGARVRGPILCRVRRVTIRASVVDCCRPQRMKICKALARAELGPEMHEASQRPQTIFHATPLEADILLREDSHSIAWKGESLNRGQTTRCSFAKSQESEGKVLRGDKSRSDLKPTFRGTPCGSPSIAFADSLPLSQQIWASAACHTLLTALIEQGGSENIIRAVNRLVHRQPRVFPEILERPHVVRRPHGSGHRSLARLGKIIPTQGPKEALELWSALEGPGPRARSPGPRAYRNPNFGPGAALLNFLCAAAPPLCGPPLCVNDSAIMRYCPFRKEKMA